MFNKNIKELLQQQLNYITKYSEFHRNRFRGVKLSVSDFDRIDFTTKQEILEDQKKLPPFGRNLSVKISEISRIHKTSGTTATPLIVALTKNDIKKTIQVGAKSFKSAGLLPSDIVVHCLNYNMWAGGYTDHQSLEAAGAAVIPFGVGNSNNLIEMMLLLKPTAIHCTPSYLAKLEDIIKNTFHISPRDLNLRLGLFGGESGLQNRDFRNYVETAWGFKAMNANYGLSEVLSMFGAECSYQNGLHFMGENVVYPELIDPKSRELVPIEKGVVGELVLTNLCKEAQPLLRYRSSDIVRILGRECKCGNTGFRFEVMGRSDDMFVIKGINIFASSVDGIISKYLSTITGIYHILLSKEDPVSKFVLKIEIRQDKAKDNKVFRERITEEFKKTLAVRPDVEFVNEGSLGRTEGKSKKLYRVL